MLFIARRSDVKDGTVPPEPIGPKAVAPHERSTSSKAHIDHAVALTHHFAGNLLRG